MIMKAITLGIMLAATPFPSTSDIVAGRDTVHVPYRPGEIDAIIAGNPSTDDLIRAMLVGDDPVKVGMLIEAIAGDGEDNDLVAMR